MPVSPLHLPQPDTLGSGAFQSPDEIQTDDLRCVGVLPAIHPQSHKTALTPDSGTWTLPRRVAKMLSRG